MFISAIIPLLAATAAIASPVEQKRNGGGKAVCRNFYADITASAQNLDFKSVMGGGT